MFLLFQIIYECPCVPFNDHIALGEFMILKTTFFASLDLVSRASGPSRQLHHWSLSLLLSCAKFIFPQVSLSHFYVWNSIIRS